MKLRLTEEKLIQIISESIKHFINENRVVTFNGRTYPDSGWCVILSGGSGSGKGFVRDYELPINGKIIDVDKFKEMYVKMNKGMINGEKFDSKNPAHVSFVHQQVKDKDWREKRMNNIMNPNTHNINRLPNLIFDITGKDPSESVVDIASKAKDVGYNTMLVWVVSTRGESIIRNLKRTRRVGDKILHSIHNNLQTEMPAFLKSSESAECLDDSWIVFGSSESIQKPEFTEEEKKKVAVRLTKTGNGFEMDKDTEEKLYRYLGKIETNPSEPEVYMPSDEVLANGEQVVQTVRKPNWKDFSVPKFKNYYTTRFNRGILPPNLLKK